MESLYNVAIEELNRLQNDAQFMSYLSNKDETTDEFLEYKEINIHRNLFNQLPLKGIDNFYPSQNTTGSLREFIEILKILNDLDVKFKELIEKYRDSYKYEHTYMEIRERLLDIIERSQFGNPNKLLKEAINDLFSNKYQRSSLSNMYFYFYNKIFAYISEYYKKLLDILADFYIRTICIDIPEDKLAKDFIYEERKQGKEQGKVITDFLDIGDKFTFLSYAFQDKLMSFLIFLEARSKKIVLFVDWMYSIDYTSDDSNGSIDLKSNLNYFLNESNKLLFLRSINSELNTSVTIRGLFAENKKMVRQWCSWEIGNFYKSSSQSNTGPQKFQYILHENVSEGLRNDRKRIENNILLRNFKVINNLSKLY